MFTLFFHGSSSQAETSAKTECSAAKSSSNLIILAAELNSFGTPSVVAREYPLTGVGGMDELARGDVPMAGVNDSLPCLPGVCGEKRSSGVEIWPGGVMASSRVASMSCGREWETGGLGGSFNVLAAMKNFGAWSVNRVRT